jgi:hypothetical protein
MTPLAIAAVVVRAGVVDSVGEIVAVLVVRDVDPVVAADAIADRAGNYLPCNSAIPSRRFPLLPVGAASVSFVSPAALLVRLRTASCVFVSLPPGLLGQPNSPSFPIQAALPLTT